jgi:ribonucleoside-diphosphate reductase alpha chain
MSNNSTAYNVKPDILSFWEEFGNLIKSGSGERGIYNREGARKQLTASGRRKDNADVGTNPCGEILLRDMEFCNLSEVIVRANDNRQSLREKVKVAAMFGAWQASFTEFPYLRPVWKQNCDEERLLGVSLTGIMDNPVLNNVNDRMKRWLGELKSLAIEETERWCERLNINMSAAVTCVKPSGTVSQLVNCSSGIHPRYSDYYIRRYRISATDPLFRMLRDQQVPLNPEVGQETGTASTFVLDFPIASPKGSKTRHDFTALQQLEHWKTLKEFWTEHNPSITVYVGEDEWLDTGAWCYRNFDDLCGVSFLPRSQHVYQLAPYEEINKSRYDELHKAFPQIDYTQLSRYEQEDNTEGSKTYGCVGDKCEI